jgi:aspartyl-tRNA(Asn)/glutamyl-tRNA(Gln) amidotransferase subunit A
MAQANGLMVTSDAAAFHSQRLQENPQGFGEDVLKRLQGGAAFTSTEYILARRTQTLARRQFEQFFGQYDVLLLPATVMAAPRIGSTNAVERARQLTRFTAPFNLTGLPALSVPGGFTTGESGRPMPLGLQIVAAPWAEARLLRLAYAFEQEVGYWKLHP